jgi:hypothetical protein
LTPGRVRGFPVFVEAADGGAFASCLCDAPQSLPEKASSAVRLFPIRESHFFS